jgi:hypothetical protein
MSVLEGMWVANSTDGGNVMIQTESYSEDTENPPLPYLTSWGLAAMGQKRIEELAALQAELFSVLQDVHWHWLDHIKSETKLASEFAHWVSNCHSIPDAITVCKDWNSRRIEIMAADSKHLLEDSCKVIERSARFLSNGLLTNGKGSATTETNAKE